MTETYTQPSQRFWSREGRLSAAEFMRGEHKLPLGLQTTLCNVLKRRSRHHTNYPHRNPFGAARDRRTALSELHGGHKWMQSMLLDHGFVKFLTLEKPSIIRNGKSFHPGCNHLGRKRVDTSPTPQAPSSDIKVQLCRGPRLQ